MPELVRSQHDLPGLDSRSCGVDEDYAQEYQCGTENYMEIKLAVKLFECRESVRNIST